MVCLRKKANKKAKTIYIYIHTHKKRFVFETNDFSLKKTFMISHAKRLVELGRATAF